MKKVAVFGNAGGGKSTLSRKLSESRNLPLHPLDKIKYRAGGGEVPHPKYLEKHAEILDSESWLVDGFGCVKSAWERFDVADTLIYVDLPLPIHYWRVTKRFLQSGSVQPEGWPDNSPMIRGTLNSYSVLWKCHVALTPRYRALVRDVAGDKTVHHLKSVREMNDFVDNLE